MRRHSTHGLCVAAAGLAAVCGITVPGVAGAVPAAQVPARPLAQPARLLAVSGTALPGTVPGARLWVGRYSGAGNGEDEGLSVAVSPDGARVFVTGTSWGGISGYDYATVAYSAATGARLWAQRYNGPGNRDDGAGSVAVSPGGTQVFVTGTSPGAGSGSDYATVAYSAATGARLWVKRYNGPANRDDYGSSVAVSPGGTRVFVTGTSQGGTSGYDYATVAYSAATGARLWAQRYNGPANGGDEAGSVAVSPGGTRVLVTGGSQGSGSGQDYATVAYSAATGARLWAQRYNGPANRDDHAFSVAVSPGGTRVFVTGTSQGSGSHKDYATLAYSAATGTRLWVRRYNGPANGDDDVSSLAVSPGGTRVFVTGTSQGSGSHEDYATLAYSAATGARLWVRRYNGPANGTDIASSLAVSPGGTRVLVTGTSWGGTSGYDYVTVAYSAATGARLWVQRYNGPANRDDEAFSLAVSPGGSRVFVTGFSYDGPATGYDSATVAYRP